MKSVLFILFAISPACWAHNIIAVKANKALLSLDEAPVKVGDIFSVQEETGKEIAQIQVTQIRDKKAATILVMGALSGDFSSYQLQFLKSSERPSKEVVADSAAVVPQARGYYGGFSLNQVSVNLTNSTTLKMSGSSFNFGAFYERALTSRVQVVGRGGYEGMKARGSLDSNACGPECDVDIGYLSGDAMVKYSFYQRNGTWWLGGGLGFLFPLIKSSNVIDSSKMSLTERILVSGGLNWYQSPTVFFPIQVDYAIQPSNSVVVIQQVVLRVGYGWVF